MAPSGAAGVSHQPGPGPGDVRRGAQPRGCPGGRRSPGRAHIRRTGPGGPSRTGPRGSRPGPRPRSRCGRRWTRWSRSPPPPGWCGGSGPAWTAPSPRGTRRGGCPSDTTSSGQRTSWGDVPWSCCCEEPGGRQLGGQHHGSGRSGTCGSPRAPPPWTAAVDTVPTRGPPSGAWSATATSQDHDHQRHRTRGHESRPRPATAPAVRPTRWPVRIGVDTVRTPGPGRRPRTASPRPRPARPGRRHPGRRRR